MKRRFRAIGNAMKAQKAHHDDQVSNGCAACHLRKNRFQPFRTELHHRTTGDLHGNKQLGQDHTVALCSYHHRGVLLPGMTAAAMRDQYGPSLQLHKTDFVNWLQDTLGERSTAALQKFQDDAIRGSKAA
jgi:hypothetical protein